MVCDHMRFFPLYCIWRTWQTVQQPLPSRLHDVPSARGRDLSPASSGIRVTVPSSSRKHGIPAAPDLLAPSKAALLSLSLRNSFRFFTCAPISTVSYRPLPFACSSTYSQSGHVRIPYIFIIDCRIIFLFDCKISKFKPVF